MFLRQRVVDQETKGWKPHGHRLQTAFFRRKSPACPRIAAPFIPGISRERRRRHHRESDEGDSSRVSVATNLKPKWAALPVAQRQQAFLTLALNTPEGQTSSETRP
jgi:hypothetical protein